MPSQRALLAMAMSMIFVQGCSSVDSFARPIGSNCSLVSVPAGAGEESGRGVLLQVFPRARDIGPGYSGCQAVFATTKDGPTKLAWLMEVVDGDPVRLWSDDKSMGPKLGCRFKHGKRVAGEPSVCDRSPIALMPSQPAGCVSGSVKGEACEYDGA